ncbi:MAG: transglutaminase-like domain-containing protein [Metallibacterium sp.]
MFDFINLMPEDFLNKRYNISFLNNATDMGKKIKQMIGKYSKYPQIINAANSITSGCFDEMCKIEKIYKWVQSSVTFQDDPNTYERLIAPDLALNTILQYGQIYEDCDSITALMGSLLTALGITVSVAMSKTDSTQEDYSHVYLRAKINSNGTWYYLPLDATYKENNIGYEYPSSDITEI